MRRDIFPVLIAIIAVGCTEPSAPAVSNPAPASSQAIPPGWKIYEDDWIKVSYPEGSEVAGAPNGVQEANRPMFGVVPPGAGGGIDGTFSLQLDPTTKGMLLRDAIQTGLKGKGPEPQFVIAPPVDVKVGNGKCLTARVTRRFDNCPKNQGACYSASVITLCDDFAGRRYTASTVLSRGNDPRSLSPAAQREAAIYERILRSLEFKKS